MHWLRTSDHALSLAWHCLRCSPCCLPYPGQRRGPGQTRVPAVLLLGKGFAHPPLQLSAPLRNANSTSVHTLHSGIEGICAM